MAVMPRLYIDSTVKPTAGQNLGSYIATIFKRCGNAVEMYMQVPKAFGAQIVPALVNLICYRECAQIANIDHSKKRMFK